MSLSLPLAACKPAAPSVTPVARAPAPETTREPPARAEPDDARDPSTDAPTPEVDGADAAPTEPAPPDADATPEPDDDPPEDPRARCPEMGEERFVYAIGSSTLASLLGPTLKQEVKRRWSDVTFRKWGKASSGMARPDFHDWTGEIPDINREYDPDIYIVNLGTNDAQPLWDPQDKWIHAHTPAWRQRYGERVDRILELMAGEDRRRMIVWVGPSAFPKKNSRRIGPQVNEVLKQRVEAFDGNAFYVDAFTTTSPRPGEYIETVTLRGKTRRAYGDDGIHLSPAAVTVLMARPLLKIIARCLDAEDD